MRNRIKQWSLISVFAGLILLLTGCYAVNVDNVKIHFPNGGLADNENMYIRYEDGSTVLIDKQIPSVTGTTYTYTVATQRAKKVIGYFVEGDNANFHYNWVPPWSDYPTTSINEDNSITLNINLSLNPQYLYKPTHEISYAKVFLADPSTGIIILYDKNDNPINPYSEGVDLFVKTDNKNEISFIDLTALATDAVSISNVTDSVYQVSSATLAAFHSSNNLQEYTIPDLELTVYSGTSTIPIPIYAYDYVPQLDLKHDGVVDIEDVVLFAKNPTDLDHDGVKDRKDIQIALSAIQPHSQTLRIITNPVPFSLILD